MISTKYPVPSTEHRAFLLVAVCLLGIVVQSAAGQQPLARKRPPAAELPTNVATLASASPLYEVRIMVRAGSADDPAGKEGTASLLGRMMLEGGYGDPKNPGSKEKLAVITRPWGEAAYPQAQVEKETTTYSMTVPRDVFPQFVARVLKPMLTQPLFLQAELERIRKEALVGIRSNLRFEQHEQLGMLALDDYMFQGTPLGQLAQGSVQGLQAVTRDDLQVYYRAHYEAARMFIAATITVPPTLMLLLSALPPSVP